MSIKTRRLFAILVITMMILTVLPMTAFAQASLVQSTVSVSPSKVAADGIAYSTVTVSFKDASGNAAAPGVAAVYIWAERNGSLSNMDRLTAVTNTTATAFYSILKLSNPTAATSASFRISSEIAGEANIVVGFSHDDSDDALGNVAKMSSLGKLQQSPKVTFEAGEIDDFDGYSKVDPEGFSYAIGSAPQEVVVTVKDTNNAPLAGKVLTATSNRPAYDTIAVLGTGKTNSSGVAKFNFTSIKAGQSKISVYADGTYLGQVTAEVTGGNAATITYSKNADGVVAVNQELDRIEFLVKDAEGNSAGRNPGTGLNITAGAFVISVSGPTDCSETFTNKNYSSSDGKFTFNYTPNKVGS